MGSDSVRDAIVALEGARTFQLPISGPFVSIAPVTTGPWYWIQLILFRHLLPTNYAPWILIGLCSVLMVVVMYLVGLFLEGKRLALILAAITTFSRNQVLVATELVNPSVVGFYSGVVLLLSIWLWKRGPDKRLGLLLGVVFGILLTTHYQSAGLVSLLLTLLLFGRRYLSTFVHSLVGIVITLVPLLCFELTNHWFNTRHLLRYLLVDQYQIWTPMRWLTYVSDFWPRFIAFVLGGGKPFGLIVMLSIAGVFGFQLVHRKLPRLYLLILINFIVSVVIIRYYRGERYFGYLQFFHPFLILFSGYVIDSVFRLYRGRVLGWIVLMLYLSAVIPSTVSLLQPSAFTEGVRQLSERTYMAFGPGPFRLYQCKGATNWDIGGLMLQLTVDRRYSESGKPLIYRWGCSFPDVRHDGTKIYDTSGGELQKPERFFPKMENLYDISVASPAAVAALGWEEVSPASMYQSAARWWMDEQP